MLSLASAWHWTFLCTPFTSCPAISLPNCLQTPHCWCRIDADSNRPLKTSSQVNITSESAKSINKSLRRRRLLCCGENKLLKKVRLSFAVWVVCFNVTTSVWTELFLFPYWCGWLCTNTLVLCECDESQDFLFLSQHLQHKPNKYPGSLSSVLLLLFGCLWRWHVGLWEVVMVLFSLFFNIS